MARTPKSTHHLLVSGDAGPLGILGSRVKLSEAITLWGAWLASSNSGNEILAVDGFIPATGQPKKLTATVLMAGIQAMVLSEIAPCGPKTKSKKK